MTHLVEARERALRELPHVQARELKWAEQNKEWYEASFDEARSEGTLHALQFDALAELLQASLGHKPYRECPAALWGQAKRADLPVPITDLDVESARRRAGDDWLGNLATTRPAR